MVCVVGTVSAAATAWTSLGSPYTPGQPAYTSAYAQSAPVGTPWLDPTSVMTVAYDRQLAVRLGSNWQAYLPGSFLGEPSFAEVGTTGCTAMAVRNTDDTVSAFVCEPDSRGGCSCAPEVNLGGATSVPAGISAWYAPLSIRVDVFINEDSQLKVRTLSGYTLATATWSAWTPLNGTVRGAPAAVSWDVGRVDVVVRGTDNAFWLKSFTAGAWTSSFYYLGGTFRSDPSVMAKASNRLDVVGRALNDTVARRSWNGNSWDSSWRYCNGSTNARPSIVWDRTNSAVRLYLRGFDWSIWAATGNCD